MPLGNREGGKIALNLSQDTCFDDCTDCIIGFENAAQNIMFCAYFYLL